jgi:hypothetical protein
MIPRLTTVLTRLNTEWVAQFQPDAILAVCQEAGDPSWRDAGTPQDDRADGCATL